LSQGATDVNSLVLHCPGKIGPGKGKRIILVSGDDEYRSEEGLPQLAKILAEHHGFDCTVLFPIDPKDGTINPKEPSNIPGLENLDSADLAILMLRFRHLPDSQMKHIADYVASGRPLIGMRTSTHAFDNAEATTYGRFGWQSKQWPGGFGREILGETWIDHHGHHGQQSTRGILPPAVASHPILRGIHDGDIWGPTDVYAARLPLPSGTLTLVLGQVVAGMKPNDPPAPGNQNNPMMPIAWVRKRPSGKEMPQRIFTTTMGSAEDLQSEGLRRLLVNASYWCLGMEAEIPEKARVELVGEYHPHHMKFDGFTKGVHPSDLR
jgi:hypothetical protein